MHEIENLIKVLADKFRKEKLEFLIVIKDEHGIHSKYRVKDNLTIKELVRVLKELKRY